MKRTGLVSLVLATAAAAFAWSAALGQDAAAPGLADAKVGVRWTKQSFDRLLGRMAELGILLEKSNPDSARALREAVRVAQAADISTDMSKVIDLLAGAMPVKAAGKEAEIIENLRAVLEALRRSQPAADPNQIRTLEGFLEDVGRLRAEEANLVRENPTTRPSDPAGGLVGQIGALIEAQTKLMRETAGAGGDPYIRILLELRKEVRLRGEEQTKIAASTGSAPIDKLPLAGAVQGRLADKTDQTAGKVSAAAKDAGLAKAILAARADPNGVARAGVYTADAADEMRKAAKALAGASAAGAARPQDSASGDLTKADEVLTALIDKMAAGTPSGALAGKQTGLENAARALAEATTQPAGAATTRPAAAGALPEGSPPPRGDLRGAADAMAGAAARLASQDPNAALADQKRAIQLLEGVREYELAQLHYRPDDPPRPPRDQTEPQKRLAQDANQLAGAMQRPSGGDGGKEIPGRKNVQNARDNMNDATGKLAQGRPGDAKPDQEEAVKQLKIAEDIIHHEIDLLREDLIDRQLADIEQDLSRILESQKAISKETRTSSRKLLAAAGGDRTEVRTVELALTTRLAPGEANLAGLVQQVLDLLAGEGKTKVFPFVLGAVKKDLLDVEKRLGQKDPGALTQAVQADIERSLEELIGAIRDRQIDRAEKRKNPPPPPPPPPPDPNRPPPPPPPPLLPDLAEIKMLRAMQAQINGRTALLDRQAREKVLPADQIERQSKDLSERESDVRRLTDALTDGTAARSPRRDNVIKVMIVP